MSAPTVDVRTRLRERHGYSAVGVITHLGFFLLVLASALTLMEHRPRVVNLTAEKQVVLTADEVQLLIAGVALTECEDNPGEEDTGEVLADGDPVWHKVTFQWFRQEIAPAETPDALGTGRWFFDADELVDKRPTHVRMRLSTICDGEAVEQMIGPFQIKRQAAAPQPSLAPLPLTSE